MKDLEFQPFVEGAETSQNAEKQPIEEKPEQETSTPVESASVSEEKPKKKKSSWEDTVKQLRASRREDRAALDQVRSEYKRTLAELTELKNLLSPKQEKAPIDDVSFYKSPVKTTEQLVRDIMRQQEEAVEQKRKQEDFSKAANEAHKILTSPEWFNEEADSEMLEIAKDNGWDHLASIDPVKAAKKMVAEYERQHNLSKPDPEVAKKKEVAAGVSSTNAPGGMTLEESLLKQVRALDPKDPEAAKKLREIRSQLRGLRK